MTKIVSATQSTTEPVVATGDSESRCRLGNTVYYDGQTMGNGLFNVQLLIENFRGDLSVELSYSTDSNGWRAQSPYEGFPIAVVLLDQAQNELHQFSTAGNIGPERTDKRTRLWEGGANRGKLVSAIKFAKLVAGDQAVEAV